MRKMKDSGIEWIGKIPENWKVKPIHSLFKEVTQKNVLGQVKNALKFTYGAIVDKTAFDADSEEYVANTILNYTIVKSGTIVINGLNLNYDFISQRVGLVKKEGIITSAYITFKADDEQRINPYFSTHLFKSYDNIKAFHNMGGGVRKILNFGELKRVSIPLPSLPEQKKIVSYLDKRCGEIDSAIGAAKELIEEYKEYKRSLITEAVTKGLDPKVKTKDSGVEWIGKIPEHWNVTKVKYLGDLQSGDNITSEDINGDGLYPVYGGNGYRGCYDKYTNDGEYVLIGRQGALAGNVHLVTGKFWATDHALVFYSNGKSENKYAYYGFLSMNLNQYAFETAAQPGLAATKILNLQFILSPIPEQKAIAKYLDEKCSLIDSLISEKESLVSELEEYKKSLIFECVTGKKEVA